MRTNRPDSPQGARLYLCSELSFLSCCSLWWLDYTRGRKRCQESTVPRNFSPWIAFRTSERFVPRRIFTASPSSSAVFEATASNGALLPGYHFSPTMARYSFHVKTGSGLVCLNFVGSLS